MPSTRLTTPEFSLIRRLKVLAGPVAGVAIGMGDDCAVLEPSPGHLLVTCTDTLVAGVHFLQDTHPSDIAHKALAVNVSDLAAMGARPRWTQLALTLPTADSRWIDAFIAGWQPLAHRYGVALVGGDTTSGPLCVTVQALGEAERSALLTRSGGRPGDLLAVTGNLGGAALALQQIRAGVEPSVALAQRLHRPEPQVAAGRALAGLATACIDLSDGLAGDLNHLTTASGTGAVVDVQRVPCHPELLSLGGQERLNLALCGGDDYELCFALAPQDLSEVRQRLAAVGVAWQLIGELTKDDAVIWEGLNGMTIGDGWQHFGGSEQ